MEIEIAMEMEIEMLMTCPECNIDFNYYDFISHTNTNICRYESNEIENYMMNNDENTVENSNHNNNTHTHTYTNTYTYTYNGMRDYGNYLDNYLGNTNTITHSPAENNNLYNPMQNRGFHNGIGNYNDADILTNSLLNININSGIDKYKLLQYSKIIQCSERTDCPICLCSYPEETSFYSMNCNHSFCIECCEKWFSSNVCCPLCRMNYN